MNQQILGDREYCDVGFSGKSYSKQGRLQGGNNKQLASLSYSANESIKILPSTIKQQHQQIPFSSETTPVNLQRIVITKELHELQSTPTSRFIQPSEVSKQKITRKGNFLVTKVKPFEDLAQGQKRIMGIRPAVPQNPKNVFQGSTQLASLSNGKDESVGTKMKISQQKINDSSLMPPAHHQKPSVKAKNIENYQLRLKSFTELVQEQARIISGKDSVLEKQSDYSYTLQPARINTWLQNTQSAKQPNENLQQNLFTKEQKPSSVNKLRQQFEQKSVDQQIDWKATCFFGATVSRPDPSSSTTPNVVNSSTGVGRITPCESESLPRISKQDHIKLIPSNSESPFAFRFDEIEKAVEATNLIIKTCTVSGVDELNGEIDDYNKQPVPEERFYENCNLNTNNRPEEVHRLLSQKTIQRSSYAEPQTRRELKPSMSFNQIDHRKACINQKNEDVIRVYAKCDTQLEYIIEELLRTEEDYVQNLLTGIKNYGNIFSRKDLPTGLQGKNFHLFGNIEHIALFHRDILLPMLQRNRNNLSRLFEDFSMILDENGLYGYVLYMMNKRRSLKICENFAPYFAHLRMELGEKLGIGSFLLEPIQRLPRYSLLLSQFLKALFSTLVSLSGGIQYKHQITLCCCLEKKIRSLLEVINEADVISDIIGWSDLNIYDVGNKFRKVLELHVFDYDRNCSYATKVFVFDKSMIYTEIRANDLIFRGSYDHNATLFRQKNHFTMTQGGLHTCEFRATPSHITYCLKFIDDMINFGINIRTASNEINHKEMQ